MGRAPQGDKTPSVPAPVPVPTPVPTPTASKNAEVLVPKNSSVVPQNPIKYQYYQSDDCLNISVLAKGLLTEEVSEDM